MSSSSTSSSITLDSLYKYKYEKNNPHDKYSYDCKENSNDSISTTNSSSTNSRSSKSTAKKSSVISSDSDNEDQFKTAKSKPQKKRIVSSSDEEEEDDKKSKVDKKIQQLETKSPSDKLQGLIDMFPNTSELKIRTILKKSKYNVQEAFNLLHETNNDNISQSSTSEQDDDDDDNCDENSNQSSKTNGSSVYEHNRKRKYDDDKENFSKNPTKKKKLLDVINPASNGGSKANKKPRKRCTIASSDDGSDYDGGSGGENEAKATTSQRTTTHRKKEPNRMMYAEGSDANEDDEFDDKDFKMKSKKSKKNKKQKKRSKYNSDGEQENQMDDDYFDGSDCDNNSDSDSGDAEKRKHNTPEIRDSVLEVFNTASLEEIMSLLTSTPRRLKAIISMRPFKSYDDMEKRLTAGGLVALIDSAKQILHARGIVNKLLNKCEDISQRLQSLVSKLLDKKNDSDNVDESNALKIKKQPKILNPALSLKSYQLIGLNWMCIMHSEGLNGILADEMGLGKTIQTIAFIGYLIESGFTGPHLIVVPPSTLDNWIREIETWCPSISYLVYSGSIEERRYLRHDITVNKFEQPLNVLLTSYSMISSTTEDKAFFKRTKFYYSVFDEAHMLKNMSSIRYQSLIQIRSKKKLLLTGTPLQNNLVELMSLLNFVMPDIFHHKTHHIQTLFSTKNNHGESGTFFNDKCNQAKGIMKPFILRRVKTDVLKQLPKKTEHIIYCPMSERQSIAYKELLNNYLKRREDIMAAKIEAKSDDKSDNKKNIADTVGNILMELRKGANHPLLRRVLYDDEKILKIAKLVMTEQSADTVLEYVVEDLSVLSDFQIHQTCPMYNSLKSFTLTEEQILDSGKFKMLDKLLAEKKANGDKCLVFSQFLIVLDIVEVFMKSKGYKYCRLDGTTRVDERQEMIDEYNKDPELFVFLLSTRAGGMGINLTSANTVILHDIDYNPFNDKQAEDRCHRVGQTREVHIYKLLSKDSIDETMLKIQEHKLKLGDNLTNETSESQSKSDMLMMLKEVLKLN